MQQLTAYALLHQLPNHLLMKVDKATMAHAVEARLPSLDPSLVEFTYSLPARFKHRGWLANPWAPQEKHLLRRVASRYLPAEIVARRKFGMLLPVGELLARHREAIRSELLESSDSPLRQCVSRDEIERLFDPPRFPWEHSEKEWFLWKLYLFHLWARWLRS